MIKSDTYNQTRPVIHADKSEAIMSSQMTLIEFVDVWLKIFKINSVKASTYDRLVTSLTALKNFAISEMTIAAISLIDIQEYINELVAAGYSMSSIKKQIQIVTVPLKYAASLRIIPSDPSIGMSTPTIDNIEKETKEVSAYDKEEQAKLKAVIDKSNLPAYICCQFMIETGLRVGEALALKWSDVDIQNRKLKVRSTVVNLANKKKSYVQNSPKTHSSNRAIPLTDTAIELLFRLKLHSETQWVFENDKDRLSYESLRYRTRALCEEAGVEYRGEHVFRHTFATNCYYKRIDIKILSKLLGHADVYTTYNTYVNLYGDGFNDLRSALIG